VAPVAQVSPEMPPKAPPKPKAQRKPRTPKPKPEPAVTVEVSAKPPEVKVLKFDFDPKDPKMGSIELDWNDEFVALLSQHGYQGATAEDKVDAWLNDVCRTILMNQYPGVSVPPNQFTQRRDMGEGKTEIS
jgi:hypothetical protein